MNLIKRSLDIRNGFLKWLTFNYILKAGWNFHNWRWEHRKNHCGGGGGGIRKGPDVEGMMWGEAQSRLQLAGVWRALWYQGWRDS